VPGWAELLSRPVLEVAPALLGATLTHDSDEGRVVVALTEVEAYDGQDDPASHAYRGKTPRNEIMFGAAGHLYVYFSYGMHWCCNIVTGTPGRASAVLMRAGRVLEGADLARVRRGERTADRSLARGPACLAQALGIDKAHNGVDLLDGGRLRLEEGKPVDPADISCGPRVGVSLAHDVPWRFWVSGDETVSAYKRSPRA
jgi:DNA-3-methyladenine glycosylase